LFGLDLLGEIPAGAALLQRLGQNPNVQGIAARRDAGMASFIAAARAKVQAAG
jgi:glutathione S-transferase